MKLAAFTAPDGGKPMAGLVEGERVVGIGPAAVVRDVLAGQAIPEERLGEWSLPDVALLAPIQPAGTIYAIGLNYARHIEETGGTPPEQPLVFVKVPGSAAPPSGPIRCPGVVRRLDYEGELTIVIGRENRIAGFCVANDVTARDLQRREAQWTRAKGADTFCPYGPWVTTAEEVPDPGRLRLRTWVNGEPRQDSNTSDLIFGCQELVAFIAETCTLRPGDLILTGTPSGVGMGFDPPRFLASGDVVRIEIERLGTIEQRVA